MQTEFDLIIVGGGLVGCALVCALKDSGLRMVIILERGGSQHKPQLKEKDLL